MQVTTERQENCIVKLTIAVDERKTREYLQRAARQAIAEARSRGIITQAITVNLPASPQLDDLYGPVRHTVISNVNELPDKLLRLYGTLTRA